MRFCTVINCMDGRVQIPVNQYLQTRFKAEWVDTITEPGPNGLLAEGKNTELISSILNRLDISIDKHQSVGVALVGHYDCAGNPVSEEVQKEQLQTAVKFLKEKLGDFEVISLWVDEEWHVHEISN